MAANPLLRSINLAVRSNAQLGDIFAGLGGKSHPRSGIWQAHKAARSAMRRTLSAERYSRQEIADTLAVLRSTDIETARRAFQRARALGEQQASQQLQAYGVTVVSSAAGLSAEQAGLQAVEAAIDAERARIMAMLASGVDPALVVGDAERAGIISPASLLVLVSMLVAQLVSHVFAEVLDNSRQGAQFQKQAISALDERTTDCCLQAHGQVVPLDKPFHLTGTPRYADYLEWTPFHGYCRTSVALYQAQYDDGLTVQMRASARWVQAERAAGRVYSPRVADAFVRGVG